MAPVCRGSSKKKTHRRHHLACPRLRGLSGRRIDASAKAKFEAQRRVGRRRTAPEVACPQRR
ncbi:hypothetical protein BD626DRAFT_484648 [Schizophyllum amplum]|uniref:Uncharacterized protein n=1 Tax=Schizophyllum amplum TaxID=97359 RepID=A0A550CQK3_9AGAR|nr:hypothetical protein BD626DRAFT_484648 [Auriculariopsis ampla]